MANGCSENISLQTLKETLRKSEERIIGEIGMMLQRMPAGDPSFALEAWGYEATTNMDSFVGMRPAMRPSAAARQSCVSVNDKVESIEYTTRDDNSETSSQRSGEAMVHTKSFADQDPSSVMGESLMPERVYSGHHHDVDPSYTALSPEQSMGSPLVNRELESPHRLRTSMLQRRTRFQRRSRTSVFQRGNPVIFELEEDDCIVNMVAGSIFGVATTILVVCNALFIGIEVNMNCEYRGAPPDAVQQVLSLGDYLLLLFFTIEWILRIYSSKCLFFWCSVDDRFWNWLDTFTLLLQILNRVSIYFISNTHNAAVAIRTMRLVRLLRIIRLLRILQVSDDLSILAHAIASSMAKVVWTLVLMATLIFTFSVAFSENVWSVSDEDLGNGLEYYFRNVPRTALTLAESILGGLSWDEVAWLLFSEVGWLAGVTFILFIVIGLFVLVNVVTAVFNDQVFKTTEEDENRHLAEKLDTAIFGPDQNDTASRSETIDWEGFCRKVETNENMKAYFHSINLEPDAVSARQVFKILDLHDQGCITRNELFDGCLRLRGPARAVDVSLMTAHLFQLDEGLRYVIKGNNRINRKFAPAIRPSARSAMWPGAFSSEP